jgi:subtilisin family serine protease
MSIRHVLFALLLLATVAGCASSQSATAPSDAPPEETATAPSSTAPSESDQENSAATDEQTPAVADSASALDASAGAAAQDWFHRDTEGGTPGMSTDRAYRTLLADRSPRDTVVVAIIDSGVDIAHEDLQPVVWTNEDEVPGNGVDDDDNGYVDDVHGWNFIGGPDGENVQYDTYEVTRLYRALSDRFADVDSASVPPSERDAYARYQRIKSDYEAERAEAQQQMQNVRPAYRAMEASSAALKNYLQTDTLSQDAVSAINSPRADIQRARDILMYFYQQGIAPADLTEYYEYLETQLQYHYNPDFNPRPIVGDDYSDKTERTYGNNDVTGPDASHGTHVAGIVGAVRGNGIGVDGVATGVRIMAIRAVPNGDERDKDVANAIRYAADNGADIINMSFGKGYSPYKAVVDAAVQHADSMGVLMVHAAGNDGANIDSTDSFPTRHYAGGGEASLWLEVGASSPNMGETLPASFSNYGAETVDVFAPGASIYSTVPGNGYEQNDGTSFAAPMVTGLAALLMAYHPELTAEQVREVVLESSTPYGDTTVTVPGGDRTAPFASLSRTGAVINAYAALQLAAAMRD